MVQMLVETKVNPDYVEKESIAKIRVQGSSEVWGSNLSTACLTANIDIVKMLLDRGARLDVADEYGRRPIHFALYRTLELVKFLRSRGAELFVEDSMQRNALQFAIVLVASFIFSCKYDDDEDNPDEDYPDGGYMDYILQDISYSDSDAGYDADDQNDECEFEDAEDNDENIKGDD
ncbi:hypothetical protein AARAC_011091 [Aspergillus arachidicola]|uniref:Uncharacterized protein n=1 Tax=Aspergillus arachidicola TaxID=656916 RepID=A0A2G7FSY8_9EURO|nr:hypothetical protein AARAC_011091 [Aspergillus arachidicola]